MPQLFTNNAASTLASTLGQAATSLVVQTGDGALFPSPTGGDYFLLTLTDAGESTHEIVKCTARSGDTLTAERAQESTAGVEWAAGSKAELRITAGALGRFTAAKAHADISSGNPHGTTIADLGAVATDDPRLSDARTPTAHDQAWSTITGTPTTVSGYGITDAEAAGAAAAVQGNLDTHANTSNIHAPVPAVIPDGDITAGTSTTQGTITAAKLKLAAETHGGSGSSLLTTVETSADADITAAAGNTYVVDSSAWASHNTLTLPTGTRGDRIGVMLEAASDTYALIISGTGSWGTSTEWSRLIITGETADFVCVADGLWMLAVGGDGRIPSTATLDASTNGTTVLYTEWDNETWVEIPLSYALQNKGMLISTSDTVGTAATITPRRSGLFNLSFSIQGLRADPPNRGEVYLRSLLTWGSTIQTENYKSSPSFYMDTTELAANVAPGYGNHEWEVGDDAFQLWGYASAPGVAKLRQHTVPPTFMSVREVLK